MSDSIKVAIRVRPLIQREKDGQNEVHWVTEDNQIRPKSGTGKPYSFDHVFDPSTTTEDVYDELAAPIVDGVMEGFHGTVFAYGQTASGKTFTMMGNERCPGIIPRAIEEIFWTIENSPKREFLIRVSYMEIYNENVKDLLSDDKKGEEKKKNLEIREDTHGLVFVSGLNEVMVTGPQELIKLMKKGELARHFGVTNMNERSSRSHTIFRLVIESRERSEDSRKSLDDGAVMVAHLNLVDLAGSEKAKQTGASGLRLMEGGFINKSLFTLGQVISQLSEGNTFINYRDSKLTRILQNALGGNSKTIIICNITQAALDETHSTLRFATSAKRVKNKPVVNEVLSDEAMLKRYKKEIDRLKKQLSTNKNTDVQDIETEKEELLHKLAEKERLEKEQEERISQLRRFICVSSQIQGPAASESKSLKMRRMTWCPGKGRLSSLPGVRSAMAQDLAIPSFNRKAQPLLDMTKLDEVDESSVRTPEQRQHSDKSPDSDKSFDLDNSCIRELQTRSVHFDISSDNIPSEPETSDKEIQTEACMTIDVGTMSEEDTISYFPQGSSISLAAEGGSTSLAAECGSSVDGPTNVLSEQGENGRLVGQLQSTIKNLSKELAEERQSHSKQIEDLHVQLRMKEQNLEAVTSVMEQGFEQQTAREDSLHNQVFQLKQELAQHKESNDQSPDLVAALEAAKAKAEEEKEQLQKLLTENQSTYEAELETLRAKINEFESKSEEVTQPVQDDTNMELRNRIQILEEELNKLKNENVTYLLKIQDLEEHLSNVDFKKAEEECHLINNLENLQSDLSNHKTPEDELQTKLDLIAKIEELRLNMKELEQMKLAAENNSEELEDQMEQFTLKICQLEEENELLQKKQTFDTSLALDCDEVESLRTEVNELKRNLQDKETELDKWRIAFEGLEAGQKEMESDKNSAAEQVIEELGVQFKELEEQQHKILAETTEEKNVLLLEMEQLKTRVYQLEEENENLRGNLGNEALVIELEQLRTRVAEMEEEKMNMSLINVNDSDTLLIELEQMKTQNHSLEEANKKLICDQQDTNILLAEVDEWKMKTMELEFRLNSGQSSESGDPQSASQDVEKEVQELRRRTMHLEKENQRLAEIKEKAESGEGQEQSQLNRDEFLEAIALSEEFVRENGVLKEKNKDLLAECKLLQILLDKLKGEHDIISTELEDLREFTVFEADFTNASILEKQRHPSGHNTSRLSLDSSVFKSPFSCKSPRVSIHEIKKSLEEANAQKHALEQEHVKLKKAVTEAENQKNDTESLLEVEKQKFRRRETELKEQLEQAYSDNKQLHENLQKDNAVGQVNNGAGQVNNAAGQVNNNGQDEEVHLIQDRLREVEDHLKTVQEEKAQLQADLEEQISMAVDNQTDILEKDSQITKLRSQLVGTQDELEGLRTRPATESKSASDQLNESVQQELSELNEHLLREKHCLSERVEQLESEKHCLGEKLQQLESEKHRLPEQSGQLESEKHCLAEKLEQLESEKHLLSERIQQLEFEKTQLKNNIEEVLNANSEEQNQYEVIRKEKESLEREKQQLLEELQREKELHQEGLTDLESSRFSTVDSEQTSQTQSSMSEDDKKTKERLESLQTENEALVVRLQEFDKIQNDKQTLTSDLEKLKSENSVLQESAGKVEELERQLSEASEELSSFRSAVSLLEKKLQRLARESTMHGGNQSYLEQQLNKERENYNELRAKYDTLITKSDTIKGRLLSEENRDFGLQRRLEELEEGRKEGLIAMAKLNKENAEQIDKLDKQVYELRCQLQKSRSEEELARHNLKKAEENLESLKQEYRLLDDIKTQYETHRGRQEMDPDKMADRIKKLGMSLDLTNQRCQKFEAKAKEFEAVASKAEGAIFERNNLQRELRDLEHTLKEKQEEMGKMQQRYSATFAEIAQLKISIDSLQQQVNQGKAAETKLADDLRGALAETQSVLHQKQQAEDDLRKMDAQRAELKRSLDQLRDDHDSVLLTVEKDENLIEKLNTEKEELAGKLSKLDLVQQDLYNAEQQIKHLQQSNCTLVEEKEQMKSAEECVRNDLENILADQKTLQDSKDQLVSDLKAVDAQRATASQELKQMKEEQDSLKIAIDGKDVELDQLQKDNDSLNEKLSELENKLQDSCNAIVVEISKLKSHRDSLQEELESAKAELEKVCEDLNCAHMEVEQTTQQKQKLEQELAERGVQHSKLVHQIEEMKENYAALEATNEGNIVEIVKLEQERDSLSEKLSEIQMQQQDSTNSSSVEINRLLSQIASLEEQIEMAKSTEAQHQEEIQKALEDVENVSQEKQDLAQQFDQLTQDRDQVQAQLEKLKAEHEINSELVEQLRGEKDAVLSQFDELKSCKEMDESETINKIEELQREKQQLTESLAETEKDKTRMESLIEELRESERQQHEDLKALVQESESITQENQQMERKLAEVTAEREETSNKLEQLKAEHEINSALVEQLRGEKDAVLSQFNELKSCKEMDESETINKIEELQREKQQLTESLAEMEKDKTRMESLIEELRESERQQHEDLKALVQESESVTQENQQMEKRLAEVTAEREETSNKLEQLKAEHELNSELVEQLRGEKDAVLSQFNELKSCKEMDESETINKIEELQREKQQLTESLAEMEKDKTRMESLIEELRESERQQHGDLKALVQESESITQENQQMEKRLAEVTAEREETSHKLEQLKDEHGQVVKTLEKNEYKLAEVHAKRDGLAQQLEEMEAKILKSDSETNVALENLHREKTEVMEQLSQVENEKIDLESTLKTLNNDKQELQDNLETIVSTVESLRSENGALATQVAELRSCNESGESETRKILEALQQERQELMDSLKQAEKEKSDMDSLVQKLRQSEEQFQQDIKDALIESENITAEKQATMQKLDVITKEKQEIRQKYDQLKDKHATVLSTLEQSTSIVEQLQGEKDSLCSQLSDLKARKLQDEASGAQLQELRRQNEQLTKSLSQKDKEKSEIESMVEKLITVESQLSEKLQESESKYHEVKGELLSLQVQTTQVTERESALLAELETLQSQQDSLKDEAQSAHTSEEHAAAELKNLQQQLEKIKREKEILEEQVEQMKSVFDDYNEELTAQRRKTDSAADKLQSYQQTTEEKIHSLAEEKTKAVKRLSEYEEKCTKLQAELEISRRESMYVPSTASGSLGTENKTLAARVKRLEADLKSKQKELDHLQGVIEELDTNLDQTIKEAEDLHFKNKELLAEKAAAAATPMLAEEREKLLQRIERLEQRECYLKKEIEHVKKCCDDADDELEQEKEEKNQQKSTYEKQIAKLKADMESLQAKCSDSSEVSELRSQLEKLNNDNVKCKLRINALERELIMQADPLKKRIKSLEEDTTYLESKVQHFKNLARKNTNNQPDDSVLCQKPRKPEQPDSADPRHRHVVVGGGSGVVNSLAVYTLEAEKSQLSKENKKLKGDMETIKTQLQKKGEMVTHLQEKIAQFKAYYKKKHGEHDKQVLHDMINSPKAQDAPGAAATDKGSWLSTSSSGKDWWNSMSSQREGAENWLSGGATASKHDDEKASECKQQ